MPNVNKQKKKGLGRGLNSLLGSDFETNQDSHEQAVTTQKKDGEKRALEVEYSKKKIENKQELVSEYARIWKIAIEKIVPNRLQPRQIFEDDQLKELSSSIREQGILQPIVARKTEDKKFEIISGERRWRAAQMAGLKLVPVILKEVEDQKSLELALIENIQRANLDPMEEAEAYQKLQEEYGLTQEQIGIKVGKERATIANLLRLLNLPKNIRDLLQSKKINMGHAKSLLSVSDPLFQKQLAKNCAEKAWSVRELEKNIKNQIKTNTSEKNGTEVVKNQLVEDLRSKLQKVLGTKINIDYSNQKGKLSIYFYTDEQLNEIAERLQQ